MAVHATPNGAAVRCPSFARASQEFCVPRSSKAGEINHEGLEGHKEFAVSAAAGECDSTPGLIIT